MMTEDGQEKILQDRMSVIERNHIALQRDVQNLTANVASIATSVKGMEASIEKMSERQLSSARTNWSNLASWAAVGMLVLGLVVYEPLRGLQTAVSEHLMDGHPESVLIRLEADEKKLEERLNRKQEQLLIIEEKLDSMNILAHANEQAVLNIEREVFSGSMYRSGRPIRTPNACQ